MKSLKLLLSFSWYCITHPHERFWQALRNFSGADRIIWKAKQAVETQEPSEIDTYYWE
jgi:hypothetical protein